MQKLFGVLFILHTFIIGLSFACNGFDVSNLELSHCDGSAELLTLSDNFDVTFTNECFAVASGCVYYKDFNSARMDINVKRGRDTIFRHSEDLCANNIFGGECPVKEGKMCFSSDTKISIKPFRRIMSTMAGKYEVDFTIRHDKATSCGKLKYRVGRR